MVDTSHKAMQELKIELMKKVFELPVNKQFTMRLAKPDTWVITPYSPSWDVPRPHVLVGSKYALVIDPTDTPYNLRKFIEENITDKPLIVADTHSHNDHTYNNYLFDDCTIYMSEKCKLELRERRNHPDEWHLVPELGMTHISQNDGTVIHGGETIDLGDRIIEAIEIKPCHSPTSILYLDKTKGILFTGDELETGQINLWNIPVETFRQNLIDLKARRNEFDMICPPHNGSPVHADILDYFIENCDRVMSGIEGETDVASTSYLLNPFEPRGEDTIEYRRWDPVTKRSFWKGTAINYNVDLVFNRQLNEPHRIANVHPPRKEYRT